MKLSEIYNEDALDMLADILEPATTILSDPKVKEMYKGNRLKFVQYLLKEHKKPLIEIFAALECVPASEYKANVITMTKELLDILNDRELMSVFHSQGQIVEEIPSGSATENTEETAAE